MPTPLAKVELEAMLLMRHLSPTTSRRSRSLDRSADMVQSCLVSCGPMTIAQLGDAMSLDASTLNRQTRAMLAQGLLERIADPDGGVARTFRPTRSGNAGLVATCTSTAAALRRVTDDLESAEIEPFAGYLERFNQGLEELESLSWPRRPSVPTG